LHHKKISSDRFEKDVERSYGSFRRDLNIPADVDPDNINAVCKNGVLTITLPKAEKTKTVKVKVREQ